MRKKTGCKMTKNDQNNLRKKHREDLLLMIRELVEENESLRRTQATDGTATELDSLRESINACTAAILTLSKTMTERK